MRTIQRILHPTDFSASAKQAFRLALQVADRAGAELHLLNVAPNLGEDPVRSAYDLESGDASLFRDLRDKADAQMLQMIEAAGADAASIKRVHSRGIAPGPVILDYAGDEDVDLIVMGTHGRRGVKRLVLGSVTEEVMRQSPCDVLTVRAPDEGEVARPAVQRCLVPVDLSVYARPLLREAKTIAASFGAQIDLLHVIEPLPFPAPLMGAVSIHDLVSDPGGRTREQLDELVRTTEGPPVPIDMHVEEGHAARAIRTAADALKSDMVVMASHGLSGLEGMLLGSVTARVIRRTKSPVWVVHVEPEGFGSASEAPSGS